MALKNESGVQYGAELSGFRENLLPPGIESQRESADREMQDILDEDEFLSGNR